MISFNCQTGNHGGCSSFHNGCQCDHHPRGKHLSDIGRFHFVDVDTYPNATVEELRNHVFYGMNRQKVYLHKGRHGR